MKKFPILYSRTSTGAIQTWQIFVKDDYFYTVSGQLNGKLTEAAPNYCEAKNVGKANKTSAEEQAILEAESKVRKQLKSGYAEDINQIDNCISFIEPTLAKIFFDRKDKVKYPVIVDRKFNGGRLITEKRGQFTRKGEEYVSIPHLYKELKDLFEKYPNLVVDGEAYNHEYRFHLNEIMKLIRKSVNVADEELQKSESLVKYYVYDCYGFDNITEDTLQFERRKALVKLFKGYKYIIPVEGKIANSEEEVMEIYNEYVSDGYEGAIIRLNGKYEHKRSSNLLKLKPTDDDEFLLTSVEEGSGNWAGCAKIIGLRTKDGKDFNGAFKGTMEEAREMLKNKKNYIGKMVTGYFNGYTGLRTPNFCQFDYNNWNKGDR